MQGDWTCGRTPSCGFVACRIVGTSIGFSLGSTLRCGVLGYYGVDRREEAETEAPDVQVIMLGWSPLED